MNDKKRVLIIVLVFVLLIGGAYALYSTLGSRVDAQQLAAQEEQSEETPEETPPLAPDFMMTDAEGNEAHLSDYIGKPIVLNFWASWCRPCKMEMPEFNEKYLELGDEVQFLMVNMTTSSRESLEKAKTLIVEQEYSFPVFYDTEGDAAETYGVYSLPTTIFIDAEGRAVAQATGAIDAEILQTGIDMIK